MKLGTKKDDMATFVEEPDYSSFTETEFANNSLSKEDERIISKLIAIPDDPLDDLGAQMVDRLRRDLSANIAVLDRHEDFNKWLEQKRIELRQGFNYKLNTDEILTKYDRMIDGLGPTDTNLIKSLPGLIKGGEKAIKDHESDNTLSVTDKKEKVQSVQRKIDNMRGTIRGLLDKGSQNVK